MDPRYFVTMFKTEAGTGERRSASVHRNQMDAFFSDGWILGDDFKKEIVIPAMTREQEKIADAIKADVPSDSTIREIAASDGDVFNSLQGQAAVAAANDAAKERRRRKAGSKDE